VETQSRDVSDPSAALVASVDSTRTFPQEVLDLTKSVEHSSLMASRPQADLTDPPELSDVDKPSQVVKPRLPLLVSRRDNSSVQLAASPLLLLADPSLRLLTLLDVLVRPPLAPKSSATAAIPALSPSTTAPTMDPNPSTKEASALPATVVDTKVAAATVVATVATVAPVVATVATVAPVVATVDMDIE